MKIRRQARRLLPAAFVLPLSVLACTGDQPLAPGSADQAAAPVSGALFSTAGGAGLSAGDHVIVLRRRAAPRRATLSAIRRAGGTVIRRHNDIGVLEVRGLSDAAASRIGNRRDVVAIDRDFKVQWIPTPDEFGFQQSGPSTDVNQSGAGFFSFQWNIRQIRAHDAWGATPAGDGALVCVLDTGIDPGHEDLQGRVDLDKTVSFVSSEPFVEDLNFHGTFVSALIASNGFGMASVAPKARLCAVKVLDQTGSGSFGDVMSGIMYAAHEGADVINMSLGALLLRSGPQGAKDLMRALQRAVDFARAHGVLIVASSGNNGLDLDDFPQLVHLPSQLPGVLSVGATAPVNQMNFDALASYTNFGRTGVDVMAPGGDLVEGGVLQDLILSACSQFVCGARNFYGFAAGTSFASPHVAAEAAVIESAVPGDQTAGQLEQCILNGSDVIDGRRVSFRYGRGRVNVLRGAGRRGCGD
ncbi:MAG: S8 family serine peptidase [Gemmatimonadota bacterium]